MAIPKNHIPLPGSECAVLPGARAIGPADSKERVEVTVRVRPRSAIPPLVVPESSSGERQPRSR